MCVVVAGVAVVVAGVAASSCKGDPPAPEPAVATTKPGPWDTTFTSSRLGPLTASTEIDDAALRALFPGAEVERRTDRSEGDEFEVYELTSDGEPVFRVYPASGAASAVEVHSAKFRLDGDIAVGSTFEALRDKRGSLECFGGAEENAGKAFCSSPEHPGLVFVFPLHDPKNELYATPLEGDKLAALAGQAIEYIIWTPEGQGDR